MPQVGGRGWSGPRPPPFEEVANEEDEARNCEDRGQSRETRDQEDAEREIAEIRVEGRSTYISPSGSSKPE
jgi:hypothetical protein